MKELAADTPAQRAAELIRLTGRLSALVEQETTLFESREPHKAVELQEEKTRLAAIYRHETRLAGEDPSRLAGLDTETKARLRDSTQRFETALRRNGEALEAMKAITEGMVKAIAEEAARQKTADAGYGPGASRRAEVGSLAFNETV